MTSEKQVAANKDNAKKSTGPKSKDGKIQTAGNAIKHGILSQRLILPGEDQHAFIALQDDLRLALRPMGTLELILVEKIAVVIWKQKRLTAASSASIQLATRPENNQVRGLIDKALGGGYVSVDDILPLNEEDNTQIEWCKEVVAEIESLTADVLADGDTEVLAKKATHSYKQLSEEAKEDGVSPIEYLKSRDGGLMGWAIDLKHWCKKELKDYAVREKIPPILQLVQEKESAHIGMELMNRYQGAIDNELYRAMDALRKQQDWRQKNGIDLEAEVEVA
jgi:hypothetical protein